MYVLHGCFVNLHIILRLPGGGYLLSLIIKTINSKPRVINKSLRVEILLINRNVTGMSFTN